MTNPFGKVIYSYSRQQAIEDGVLVDISDQPETKEAGFRVPVCLTIGVFTLVEVPLGPDGEPISGQDFKGRLWDLLNMALFYFRAFTGDKHLVPFKVIFQTGAYKTGRPIQETFTLWLCFNEAEGFTIMKPEEY